MSKYDTMKIICMFDLPTDTDREKKQYRDFRKNLILNGFIMMQYSVYVRACPNRDFANKFIPKLKRDAPKRGNIRLLMITEKQYNDMEFIVGETNHIEKVLQEGRIIVI